MDPTIQWLLNQGGVGALAVGAIYAVRALWRWNRQREEAARQRDEKREDRIDEHQTGRVAELEKQIGELHANYQAQIAKLQERRVGEQRLILQAATGQGAAAEVMKDAMAALEKRYDAQTRELEMMRLALLERSIPLVTVEAEAEESPRSFRTSLRGPSVRFTQTSGGLTVISPPDQTPPKQEKP